MTLQEIRQQYPQYEDMSDAELARALHSRYYSDMDFGEFSQRVGFQPAEPPSRMETALDVVSQFPGLGFLGREGRQAVGEVGRQVGLTGRHIVEGVAAIPAMVAQPVADVADLGLQAAGSDFRFGNQRQGVSRLLDRANLPRPQNALERVVGDASQALTAGGGIVGTAQRFSNPIARMIAATPGAQGAGEVGGAALAGTAREMGASPLAQMTLGLTGGFGAGAAVGSAPAIARGTRGAIEPFTGAGRENIVARILRDNARDPRQAANRLGEMMEIVPGSVPTTGAASRDVGLIALEKGMRNRNPAEFGERLSQQNLARQQALDDISGSPADIAAARARRDAETASARDDAFAGQPQVDTASVLARADEILAGPAGARQTVRRAVTQFRDAIEGETDAMRLYEIRKDIGDALGGRLAGDRADFKLASRELIDLRNSLDAAIENVAPGFRAYLDRYSELSKPINQMEILQELQSRSALAAPDVSTGRDFLSQARFTRNLDNILGDERVAGDLTDEQIAAARAVAADLDLGSAVSSSLVKAAGSDTVQNLSTANIIARGRASGSGRDIPPAAQSVMNVPPFTWIYQLPDAAINELLLDAMLNPQVAARLLQRPTPKNLRELDTTLTERAYALGYGAAIGAGQTAQQRPADTAPPPQ